MFLSIDVNIFRTILKTFYNCFYKKNKFLRRIFQKGIKSVLNRLNIQGENNKQHVCVQERLVNKIVSLYLEEINIESR